MLGALTGSAHCHYAGNFVGSGNSSFDVYRRDVAVGTPGIAEWLLEGVSQGTAARTEMWSTLAIGSYRHLGGILEPGTRPHRRGVPVRPGAVGPRHSQVERLHAGPLPLSSRPTPPPHPETPVPYPALYATPGSPLMDLGQYSIAVAEACDADRLAVTVTVRYAFGQVDPATDLRAVQNVILHANGRVIRSLFDAMSDHAVVDQLPLDGPGVRFRLNVDRSKVDLPPGPTDLHVSIWKNDATAVASVVLPAVAVPPRPAPRLARASSSGPCSASARASYGPARPPRPGSTASKKPSSTTRPTWGRPPSRTGRRRS
jgi:hypothetical protein